LSTVSTPSDYTLLSQLTIKLRLHALFICLKLETEPYTCGEFSEGGWVADGKMAGCLGCKRFKTATVSYCHTRPCY